MPSRTGSPAQPADVSDTAVLAEGSTFAAYEVRRQLAVGGMGEVYLCRHRMLDRLDAVKVLRPHLASDPGFRRRFLREALSAARLRHPNVVTVYTADEADGLLYLAMEYVPGEDLAKVLERMELDPGRTVRLLATVADALDAAHRAQLVHRDIKPSNLLVTGVDTAEESVTLVDFGLSRLLDDDSEITRTGEIVGTIAYCSPEQLSRRAVAGACDQYSLGCVAFECLTGQVPFPREGQLAIMTAHLTATPPRASARRRELPAAVDAVLGRALAKDPNARFPTCTHFMSALGSALPSAGSRPPGFMDPPMLAESARSRCNMVRPPGHPDALAVRVGRRADTARTPMVVRLGAGPLAIRGDKAATTGLVRWLLAQAVTRHGPRDLCLICAVEPGPEESWLWVNWLPHARPSTPPVSGPHVATSPEAAADLLARLRALMARSPSARSPSARLPSARLPTVLAVLDARLGVRPDDMRDAAGSGIHIVFLLPLGEPAPPDVATLDISGEHCRLSLVGCAPTDGIADAVDAAYVRDLAELLPDD